VVGEGLGVSGSGRAAARPAAKRRREAVNCIVGRSWDGTFAMWEMLEEVGCFIS